MRFAGCEVLILTVIFLSFSFSFFFFRAGVLHMSEPVHAKCSRPHTPVSCLFIIFFSFLRVGVLYMSAEHVFVRTLL